MVLHQTLISESNTLVINMEDWQWKKLKQNCERAKQLPPVEIKMPPKPDNYYQLTERQQVINNQMRFIEAVSKLQKARLDNNGDIILPEQKEEYY